jgi:hypothetical protein
MNLAPRTILTTLSLERLRTLARDFDAAHLWPMSKTAAVENLEKCRAVTVRALLGRLQFDELEKLCRVLALEHQARRRQALIDRILEAESAPGGSNSAAPRQPELASARPSRRPRPAARPAAPPAPPA